MIWYLQLFLNCSCKEYNEYCMLIYCNLYITVDCVYTHLKSKFLCFLYLLNPGVPPINNLNKNNYLEGERMIVKCCIVEYVWLVHCYSQTDCVWHNYSMDSLYNNYDLLATKRIFNLHLQYKGPSYNFHILHLGPRCYWCLGVL